MKKLILVLFTLWSAAVFGQNMQLTRSSRQGGDFTDDDNKTVIDNRPKPPIDEYKIISVENDTTFVDTTLTIYKDYKYNYLRKDYFGMLPFSNIGQPFTQLSYDFDETHTLPDVGARGKHFAYYEVDDIFYYRVPTPLTELFFKTTFEQGQNVDAFFTSNLTPRLNFSIAYRGLRSLGNYQHLMASQGSFRFTINYQSKNNRYDLKTHFVSQDLNNEENGGLTERSNAQFESGNEQFADRSVLDVNYEDAETMLYTKRFFLKHHYKLVKGNDSTQNNQLRLGHVFNFTDKEYRYSQGSAFRGYGNAYENVDIRDETEYQEVSNTLYARYQNTLLGDIQFKARYTDYNYGYRSKLILQNGVVPNRLTGGVFSVGGEYQKQVGGFFLKGKAMINLADDFSGNFLKASAGYALNEDYQLNGSLILNSSKPNFNFLLYQSDYINYNWRNTFDNEQRQSIQLNLKAKKIANFQADFTQINNYAYFAAQDLPEAAVTDSVVKPFQYNGSVSYSKFRLKRKFKWRGFSLDNTIQYQQVLSGEEVFRVPDFVTRHALYYEDYFFKKALFLQTGVIFNYFTSYKANAYDPVLSEFFVQDTEELEGFPRFDFVVNAKVSQTRIFFKLENFSTLFQQNTSYAAPLHPYRDFSVRFGLVWNFFL